MKLVSVKPELLEKYQVDNEVLQKNKRPYVLVIRLKYKGRNQDFAVPIRSNIPAATPKAQYFPLPPRKTTKAKNRHGIHYIKMFPIEKEYLLRYRVEGNEFSTLIKDIIDKNSKDIINSCQKYLNEYEQGNKPNFSTDIDLLLKVLNDRTGSE